MGESGTGERREIAGERKKSGRAGGKNGLLQRQNIQDRQDRETRFFVGNAHSILL